MVAEHIEGHPVSKGTYLRFGCQCRGCLDAWRDYQASQRRKHPWTHREQRRRLVLAANWMKRHRPEVWDEICKQAKIDVAAKLKEQGK